MAKFCTQCGSLNNEQGICPNCPPLSTSIPSVVPLVDPIPQPSPSTPLSESVLQVPPVAIQTEMIPSASSTTPPMTAQEEVPPSPSGVTEQTPPPSPPSSPSIEGEPIIASTKPPDQVFTPITPPPLNTTPLSEHEYVVKTKTAVKDTLPFAKIYWKNPMEATVNLIRSNNIAMVVVLLVLYGMLSGIVTYAMYHRLADEIHQLARTSNIVQVPFFVMFVSGVLVSLLVVCLTIGILFLMLRLGNFAANVKHLLMATGANTLPYSICLVIMILGFSMGIYPLVFFALGLNVILWMVLCVLIPCQVFGLRLNGANILSTAISLLLALGLSGYLGMKIHAIAIGMVEVNEVPLHKIIDETEDYVEDFIENFWESFVYQTFFN